ncbi:MAG: hypothetical protein ACI3Y4_03790 [Candidatus Cryptobacteroides sp.]
MKTPKRPGSAGLFSSRVRPLFLSLNGESKIFDKIFAEIFALSKKVHIFAVLLAQSE